MLVTTLSLGLLGTSIACSDSTDDKPTGGSSAPFTAPIPIALETQLDPQKKYRLGIVWAQLNDDGPDPVPEVGYDVPFDLGSTAITFGTITNPTEKNWLCERECTDEAVCGCLATSKFRVGYGLAVIVRDTNENGKIEFTLSSDAGAEADKIELWSFGALTYSPDGGYVMPLSKSGSDPMLLDGSVAQGTALYKAYKKTGAFDRLTPFLAGDTLIFKTKSPNVS